MDTLRLFCDVARCQSFSQAAGEHGITQSAASQRIGALERRLGVTLLDRSVRPLGLTPAGQLFMEECRQIIDRYDRLERRICQFRAEPEGQVTVAAIYSAGIDLLNNICEKLHKEHPGVSVTIEYKRPEQVYESVQLEHCDLGILSYPKRWPGVGLIPLRNERMCVVAAPQHPLARQMSIHARTSIHVRELAGHTMASFEPELPVGRRINRYFREHDVRVRVGAMFDNIDTIKSAVAITTDQFAILPRRTVLREAAAGTLTAIDLEPRLERPLGVIYHRRNGEGKQFSPAVQCFTDFLIQHAGPAIDNNDMLSDDARPLAVGKSL
jgi:DNA-binding transcriptional LysR family regulator